MCVNIILCDDTVIWLFTSGGQRQKTFGCVLKRNCCIILEKGDLFWSTTSAPGRGSCVPFVAILYRSGCYPLRDVAVPCPEYGSIASWPRAVVAQLRRCEQSVGRATRYATFVRGGLCSPPACLVSTLLWRCDRDETSREWDSATAVSQPRPPDRVDAALEKVAPLRYLEAHECVFASANFMTLYCRCLVSQQFFLSDKP